MLSRVFDPISLDAAEHFSVSLSLLFFSFSYSARQNYEQKDHHYNTSNPLAITIHPQRQRNNVYIPVFVESQVSLNYLTYIATKAPPTTRQRHRPLFVLGAFCSLFYSATRSVRLAGLSWLVLVRYITVHVPTGHVGWEHANIVVPHHHHHLPSLPHLFNTREWNNNKEKQDTTYWYPPIPYS